MPASDFVSHRIKRIFRQTQQALESRDYEKARESALKCVDQAPHIEDGWTMLAEACANLGLNSEGLEWIDKALEKWPGESTFCIQRCKFLIGLGLYQEALIEARGVVDKGVSDIWSISNLGQMFTMLDEVEQALPLYQQACELIPDGAEHWLSLAITERSCGDLENARQHVEKALSLRPGFPRAMWVLGSLRKASEDDNLIDNLEQMSTQQHWSDTDRAFIGYALGKDYEDLGHWHKAYESISQGAAARGRSNPYQSQTFAELVDSLINNYADTTSITDTAGFDCEEPVFIVGMPRTGTTMVERILGAHSEVFAAGELRQFTLTLGQILDAGRGPYFIPQNIAQSRGIDFDELGQRYIESTRPRTGRTRYFTDKLPLNFVYLGLIARALPGARFIHVRRNPMDTIWSNFKLMFGDLSAYSYDIADTAAYYVQYHRLMNHWEALIPDRILEVEYEKLVDDLEPEVQRMLAFCELPWEQGCIDFQTNPDSVTTASSVQVRQPVYRSSINRWQEFEPYLGDAIQILTKAGIEYRD